MRRLNRLATVLVCCLAIACGSDSSQGNADPDGDNVLGAPGDLRVERIGDGEIWLGWDAMPNTDLTFYVVYRSSLGRMAEPVDTTFIPQYKDFDLDYETEYTYWVTAVDKAGNEGPASHERGGQPGNNLAPLPPAGLRAGAHNIAFLEQLEILLDWSENYESDMAFYRIYRQQEQDFAVSEDNLLAVVGQPRYVDLDIEVSKVYYYRVTAVDRGDKESSPSDVVADVALPVPQLVRPVNGQVTSETPEFRWRALSNARNYRVVVTTSPASGEVSGMEFVSDTTAVFAGRAAANGDLEKLQTGQIYWWKVIASTKTDGTENSVSQVESFKIR